MDKVKASVESDEKIYSSTVENSRRTIICQDYILSDDEAKIFNEFSKNEYEDAVKYEQSHKK